MGFGFFLDDFNSEICPSPYGKKIYSGWELDFPAMYDDYSIQISRKYIVQIIDQHNITQLVSAKESISYEIACQVCELLSFLFDAIIEVSYPLTGQDEKNYRLFFKGMKRVLQNKGQTTSSHIKPIESYRSNKKEALSTLQEFAVDEFRRDIPIRNNSDSKIISCSLPKNQKLIDALYLYKQALVATEFSNQIVNYWRVLEAITTPKERDNILEDVFNNAELKPVLCIYSPQKKRQFDLIVRYRKFIKPHYDDLLKKHHSNTNIIEHLKQQRHCSAHGGAKGQKILRTTPSLSLAELYKDALLLKLICRYAVQTFWGNHE